MATLHPSPAYYFEKWVPQFTEQRNKIAQYSELSQAEREKLGEICSICYEVFDKSQNIEFLACGRHAYHEKCVKTWNPKECPLDRVPHPVTISIIKIFGRTFSFSYENQAMALKLENRLGAINQKIADFILNHTETQLEHCDQVLFPILGKIIQDVLDVYTGVEGWEKLGKSPADYEAIEKIAPLFLQDPNFQKFLEFVADESPALRETFLRIFITHYVCFYFSLSAPGSDRVADYFVHLFESIFVHPNILDLKRKIENQFYARHFSRIIERIKIDSDSGVFDYVSTLPDFVLERLSKRWDQSAATKSTFAARVLKQIHKVENKRKRDKLIADLQWNARELVHILQHPAILGALVMIFTNYYEQE